MLKKIMFFVLAGFLLVNMYGCIAILAGTAGGAGTATWLSGKSTQEFNASYERTINAAKKTLLSFKLDLVKETRQDDISQLKSKYTDGREIWIDVRKITDKTTKVEVRVGAVNPDKEAATKILKRIGRYL